MKKVAIILSGCGNRDGSELQESLSLMLAFDRHDIAYQCFAPKTTFKVVTYLGNPVETGEQRDLYAEAARIARGNILDLATYRADDYDALVLPGGMGAARNLSSFAFDGERMTVLPEVERAILDTHRLSKPVAAVCIAPMVLAKVLGPMNVKLTLGNVCPASQVAERLGARHEVCDARHAVIDRQNRVVTSPAYMVAKRISEIFDGAEAVVQGLMQLSE